MPLPKVFSIILSSHNDLKEVASHYPPPKREERWVEYKFWTYPTNIVVDNGKIFRRVKSHRPFQAMKHDYTISEWREAYSHE